MSKLYPARRVAQWWVGIGLIAVVASIAIDVAHFGFGVEIFDSDTRQPATSASIVSGTAFIGLIGVVFASAGALLLRAANRYNGS
jgi:hypothetical protein